MIDAEQKALFSKVREERREVVAAALNLNVLMFVQVINTDVQGCATGHAAGDFLTEKEIPVMAKRLEGVNRVMIRDRDQVHPDSFEPCIHSFGVVVALAAEPAHHGRRRRPRAPGVDVQIAPHITL